VLILEVVDSDTCEEAERRWISDMRSQGIDLTNFTDGGVTPPLLGKHHTEEAKAKLRMGTLERGCRPPSRKGCVPWNKGTHGIVRGNRASFRKGCTPANKGKKMSEAQILKLHLASVGKPWSPNRRWAELRRTLIKVGGN